MHDTYLNENLYQTVVAICRNNAILKVKNLTVTVHSDSHVNRESILGRFMEAGDPLIDGETDIVVKRCGLERLTAIVEHIDGEKEND